MFDFNLYQSEYKQFRSTIDRLPAEYGRDLRTMLVNLDQLVLHLKFEEVRCRQKRKVTDDYVKIQEKITEYKNLLEEQMVIACLIS